MNYELICKAVLAIFAATGCLAFLKRRPEWLVWQLVLALSLGGLNWYAGTIILPVKITLAFSLAYLLTRVGTCALILEETRNGTIWVVLFLFLLSTCMAFLLPTPDTLVEGSGLQQSWLRPFVQLYSYVSGLAIFPLVLLALNTPAKVNRFFDYYIWVVLVTSLIGFVQLALNTAGLPFMPILRWNAVHSELAGFAVGGHVITRIYALAGEPKHLAVLVLPAVFMLITTLSSELKEHRPWWSQWWILAFVGIVFVFTFSSAGLIAFVLALIYLAYVVGFRGLRAIVTFSVAFVCLLLVVQAVGSLVAVQKSFEGGPQMSEILKQRTITRLQETGDRMPEIQALEYLVSDMKPGLVLGLGPGMYVFHLNRVWESSTGVDPIDSGWIAMLADMGLVGVGTFCVFLYRVWRRNASVVLHATSAVSRDHSIRMACLASLVAAVFLNAGVTAYIPICLFMGVLEASRRQFAASQTNGSSDAVAESDGTESRSSNKQRGRRPVLTRRRGIHSIKAHPGLVSDSSGSGGSQNA